MVLEMQVCIQGLAGGGRYLVDTTYGPTSYRHTQRDVLAGVVLEAFVITI